MEWSGCSIFLLARLLFVRYAPVSERAKACKEAKGTRNKTKTESKTEPENHKQQNPHRNQTPQTRQIPLQQVRPVRRVRRSPHRTGETEGLCGPRARQAKLSQNVVSGKLWIRKLHRLMGKIRKGTARPSKANTQKHQTKPTKTGQAHQPSETNNIVKHAPD